MPVFQVGITVSRRQYRDIIVRLDAETLKEAKVKASKELEKFFRTTDSEMIDGFFNIIYKDTDGWYTYDGSLEDWDVENPSGTDYIVEDFPEPHLDLTERNR